MAVFGRLAPMLRDSVIIVGLMMNLTTSSNDFQHTRQHRRKHRYRRLSFLGTCGRWRHVVCNVRIPSAGNCRLSANRLSHSLDVR
jgi:hypothetical protein